VALALVVTVAAGAKFPAKLIIGDSQPALTKWNPPQCNSTGYTFSCCDQLDFTLDIPFEGLPPRVLYLINL
jgi:hypothetical protein